MRLLLDTCALLWVVLDPVKLRPSAARGLADLSAEVYFSPSSASEISCAVSRGRLTLDRHWKSWLRHHVALNGWAEIPIDLAIVEEAYSLPEPMHADPVDRILVATARLQRLRIVTGDRKLLEYPHVETLW